MFKYLLGFMNALPLSLCMWVLMVFLYVTRQIDKVEVTKKLIFRVDLKDEGFFFKKAFLERGWWAFGCGNSVFVKDIDLTRKDNTLKHEEKHCIQQYILGIFFLLLYLLESLRIYFFVKELHPYYDNYFEVEARKAAGQLINIPKSRWTKPRWYFW